MSLTIKNPFFPYKKMDTGIPADCLIICDSILLYKNTIIEMNFIENSGVKGSYDVSNVKYTLEFQHKYLTRDWKISEEGRLRRIYKISYTNVGAFPVHIFVKLSLWKAFRIKWINNLFWIQKENNLWRFITPTISAVLGVIGGLIIAHYRK